MSSLEAEAFNTEAPDNNAEHPALSELKHNGATEPERTTQDEDVNEQELAERDEEELMEHDVDLGTTNDNHLNDTIQRLENVDENNVNKFPTTGFTFKRTRSSEQVQAVELESHDGIGKDEGLDEQSEGGSFLPSPPGSVGTPDDTLSHQGSFISATGSNAFIRRPSLRHSPAPSLRPFDRRFQSRLAESPLASPRTSSPFFLNVHSRSSSISSQVNELDTDVDDSTTPWDVIRWTKLKKIKAQLFSESGRRSYGEPTCINIFTSIAFGTSKGLILIFDYHQTLTSIIGQNSKAVESGAITSLAISADYSTIAGGHAKGSIFTWEIGKSAKPFLMVPPIPLANIEGRKTDGHIDGTSVLHLGFLGTRHTALVSADDKGMAFSHIASRSLVGRVVKSTRILGRYPFDIATNTRPRKPSAVLAFAPLPLGNLAQVTDNMGLTAMLTPYLLVIVSTIPIAQTQHKATRPKEIASEAALSGCLAWFPAVRTKTDTLDSKGSSAKIQARLAYCWSNILSVMEVSPINPDAPEDPYKPPSLQFKQKKRWRCDEAIVAIQWLNRQIICVMTATQRLLIIEETSMRVTERFDLMPKHVLHQDYFSRQLRSLVGRMDEEGSLHASVANSFYNSVKSFKGRLFLLGEYETFVGALSNWADRLLALMEIGDFIGALKLATSFYLGQADLITVGLPEDDFARHSIVQDKLLDMIGASLRYAFGLTAQSVPIREREQLQQLADTCIAACLSMKTTDFMFDVVFEAFEDGSAEGVFLETLEPLILNRQLEFVPPTAVKALISHYTSLGLESRLEEMLCHMDPRTMDIDQVTTLCKEHHLYDALIYVWNQALSDYITPMLELLALVMPIISAADEDDEVRSLNSTNALKIFPYLSYILTGRAYPTGDQMSEEEAAAAKASLYYLLFLGRPIQWPKGSNKYVLTRTDDPNSEPSFPYLRAILEFDAPSFLSCLNEAFEDPFLNDDTTETSTGTLSERGEDQVFGRSVNRQYIVSILLEVMNPSDFGSQDTVYLDMFIARSLPKYQQYLLFPGSTLQRVLVGLCNYPGMDIAEDCQLSVEYLLSIYHPPDIISLVDIFVTAGFFRILKSVFRAEKDYSRLMETYFEDAESLNTIFDCIYECLRPNSSLAGKQRNDVKQVLRTHARQLLEIDEKQAATAFSEIAPDLHHVMTKACEDVPETQYSYLRIVFEHQDEKKTKDIRQSIPEYGVLLELYIRLMCSYDFERVSSFLETLQPGDLNLDKIIPDLEERGVVDGLVLLMAREGLVQDAMKRLIQHLEKLESAFIGLLQGAAAMDDGFQNNDNVQDLLQALQKFSKVGIWLCQGQMKTTEGKQRSAVKLKRNVSNRTVLTLEEDLWLDLIDSVVHVSKSASAVIRRTSALSSRSPSISSVHCDLPSRSSSRTSQRSHYSQHSDKRILSSVHKLVQDVFTALLSATYTAGHHTTSFLRILRAFLNRAAITSPSLADLRNVLAGIFETYIYEEQLLSLSGKLLEKDLFLQVEDAAILRQKGWKPKSQICEACGRKVWGAGAASGIYSAWEARRQMEIESKRLSKEVKDAQILRERFGSISKGKGRAMLIEHGSSQQHDGKNNLTTDPDAEGEVVEGSKQDDLKDAEKDVKPEVTSNEPGGAIVILHCGHVYHKGCLENLHSDTTVSQPGDISNENPFSPVHQTQTEEDTTLQCVVCK